MAPCRFLAALLVSLALRETAGALGANRILQDIAGVVRVLQDVLPPVVNEVIIPDPSFFNLTPAPAPEGATQPEATPSPASTPAPSVTVPPVTTPPQEILPPAILPVLVPVPISPESQFLPPSGLQGECGPRQFCNLVIGYWGFTHPICSCNHGAGCAHNVCCIDNEQIGCIHDDDCCGTNTCNRQRASVWGRCSFGRNRGPERALQQTCDSSDDCETQVSSGGGSFQAIVDCSCNHGQGEGCELYNVCCIRTPTCFCVHNDDCCGNSNCHGGCCN